MGFLAMYGSTSILPGVCFLLALAATITLFVFLLPASKSGKFSSPFLQKAHDFLNFKTLVVEWILKALYIFLSCYVVLLGFFMLFAEPRTALYALMFIILGPIIIRVFYELLMLTILLVKNVIEINKKLDGVKPATPAAPVAPVAPAPAEEPAYRFCTQCGTRFPADAACPNCGKA